MACIARVRPSRMPRGSTGPFADELQYGCGTARFVCYALPHVLPAKHHFFRADERTRTADLISLGVCGQALPSVAEVCKSCIGTGISVPCIAYYCRVLRAG